MIKHPRYGHLVTGITAEVLAKLRKKGNANFYDSALCETATNTFSFLVDDDIAEALDARRQAGETDNDVLQRLLQGELM